MCAKNRVLFALLVFCVGMVGVGWAVTADKNISINAGPTLAGEDLALVWVETTASPKNLGRGETLSLNANFASKVEAVRAYFDDGTSLSLASEDGLHWSGKQIIADNAPLGTQMVRFKIVGSSGRSINRSLDVFVNLGNRFLAGEDTDWPLFVLKDSPVVVIDKTKGADATIVVKEGTELKGLTKAYWYEVKLENGKQGWINAALVKEPVEDYHICAYEYYKVGDYAAAIRYDQKALQIDPKFAKGYFWLAKSYLKLGNENEAMAALQKVFELDPQNKEALALGEELSKRYFTAAQYDFKTGKYEEAIAGYNKVLKIQPTLAEAYIDLGRCYQAAGNTAKAQETWKQVLVFDPANETALSLLKGTEPAVAAENKFSAKAFAANLKTDKEDYIVFVKDGKTTKGTKISNALGAVLTMTKSLGTSVLERGWSVKPTPDGYRVAFLCEYSQTQGKNRQALVETFEWKVDAEKKKVMPTNKNAELLMARW